MFLKAIHEAGHYDAGYLQARTCPFVSIKFNQLIIDLGLLDSDQSIDKLRRMS